MAGPLADLGNRARQQRPGIDHFLYRSGPQDGQGDRTAREFLQGRGQSHERLLLGAELFAQRAPFAVDQADARLRGGNSGFGFVVNLARQAFDSPQIFAVIAIIVVIYVAADNLVLAPIQRRLTRQYADV